MIGSRSGIGVEQNVSVPQLLRLWAVLEVFLERVAPFDGRDGTFVDGRVMVFVGHDEGDCDKLELSMEAKFVGA